MSDAMQTIGLIVSWVIGLSGAIAGFIALRGQYKKAKADAMEASADATQSIASAATSLVQPLQFRIEVLEKENNRLREEYRNLHDTTIRTECDIRDLRERLRDFEIGTQRLIFQLKALGQEPVWMPEKVKVGQNSDNTTDDHNE